MTHLPYIVASYGFFLVITLWLAFGAQRRVAQAAKRLRAIDPRARTTGE